MQILLVFAVVAAGIGSALQSGSNQTLQKALAAPLWTVVLVSAVTLAAALAIALVARERWPAETVSQAPWWAWLGGLFGLAFVLATVFASSKLGAGLFVALTVTASVVTSLLLDHFGWLGFRIHPAGVGRILGGVAMIGGVALIALF